MSYTAPNGDAVNFSWVDALPYSPPNSAAINFAWALSPDPTGEIVGFTAITFDAITFTALGEDED